MWWIAVTTRIHDLSRIGDIAFSEVLGIEDTQQHSLIGHNRIFTQSIEYRCPLQATYLIKLFRGSKLYGSSEERPL